jgi:hypothetical protein
LTLAVAPRAKGNENIDKIVADEKKAKQVVTKVEGIGDGSYFDVTDVATLNLPIALHTFKGKRELLMYINIILGFTGTATKDAAKKLMLKVLTRI